MVNKAHSVNRKSGGPRYAGPHSHLSEAKAMKKLIVLAMVLVFCMIGLAQAKGKLTSAAVLAKLTQQGLISTSTSGMAFTIEVEPLWWKSLTHQQKGGLAATGMDVARTNENIEFVFIMDMTSKEKLATGFVKENRVEVHK